MIIWLRRPHPTILRSVSDPFQSTGWQDWTGSWTPKDPFILKDTILTLSGLVRFYLSEPLETPGPSSYHCGRYRVSTVGEETGKTFSSLFARKGLYYSLVPWCESLLTSLRGGLSIVGLSPEKSSKESSVRAPVGKPCIVSQKRSLLPSRVNPQSSVLSSVKLQTCVGT